MGVLTKYYGICKFVSVWYNLLCYQGFIEDFWLEGEKSSRGKCRGLRYNFDVYTHAAVTFWIHDAMSIDSINSQSIQLILQNSWGWGGTGPWGGKSLFPPV